MAIMIIKKSHVYRNEKYTSPTLKESNIGCFELVGYLSNLIQYLFLMPRRLCNPFGINEDWSNLATNMESRWDSSIYDLQMVVL